LDAQFILKSLIEGMITETESTAFASLMQILKLL